MHPLLERARQVGTPLFDSDSAIFLWLGEYRPALVGDFNNWSSERSPAFVELEPGLWAAELTLPRDAYAEYGFRVDGQHHPDPLNPRNKTNPFGGHNSLLHMPGFEPTPLIRRAKGVSRGILTRHTVAPSIYTSDTPRTIELYRPPTDEPVPLLVAFDGPDYLHQARIVPMMENLMAQGRMRPTALALVPNGGGARFTEYASSDSTVAFLLKVALPLAREHLNLIDHCEVPGVHGVVGASMGGLIAMYTALRAPEVFGHVLCQSGSFGLTMGDFDTVVLDLVRYLPKRDISIWMDCGIWELLLPSNRAMYALLKERGYDAMYREYSGGHNYTAWRNDVWRGLEHLFAPASALEQVSGPMARTAAG